MEEAHICLAQPGLTSLQIIFNLFRQKPIDDLFPAAVEKKVALIIRLPLASGLLAGKYTTQTTFSAQDHRTYNRNGEAFSAGETFAGLPFETGVGLADALKPLVPEGWTLAELALRWCLEFDAVTVLIPGAKDAAQARANAHVAELPPLGDELMAQLRQFYEERHIAELIRGAY
jgi:aryl-alcohol dehydrogenase-like predicted oxidoreductase